MKFFEDRFVESARARIGLQGAHARVEQLTRGGVCGLSALFPILALRGVAILRRHTEQAVAEFLGRMLEVAGKRLHNAAAVHQAQRANEAAHLALGKQRDRVAHVQEAACATRVFIHSYIYIYIYI